MEGNQHAISKNNELQGAGEGGEVTTTVHTQATITGGREVSKTEQGQSQATKGETERSELLLAPIHVEMIFLSFILYSFLLR